MGAWGHGSFENDGAADWVYELETAEDLAVVISALKRVAEAGDEYGEAYAVGAQRQLERTD